MQINCKKVNYSDRNRPLKFDFLRFSILSGENFFKEASFPVAFENQVTTCFDLQIHSSIKFLLEKKEDQREGRQPEATRRTTTSKSRQVSAGRRKKLCFFSLSEVFQKKMFYKKLFVLIRIGQRPAVNPNSAPVVRWAASRGGVNMGIVKSDVYTSLRSCVGRKWNQTFPRLISW